MVAPNRGARMDENRRALRRRVLESATIEFDGGALEFAVGVEREAGLVVIARLANRGFGRRRC